MTSDRHRQRRQSLPQCRVGAGVAGEDPGPAAGLSAQHRIAHCRHGVAGRQHLDAARAQFQHLAHFDGAELQHRVGRVGQAREVRPDDAVEDVQAQRGYGGGQCMHAHRRPPCGMAAAGDAVGQQADGKHMVEMRVADQDVVDARHLFEREVADARAGVDEDVVVDAGKTWFGCRRQSIPNNRERGSAWDERGGAPQRTKARMLKRPAAHAQAIRSHSQHCPEQARALP